MTRRGVRSLAGSGILRLICGHRRASGSSCSQCVHHVPGLVIRAAELLHLAIVRLQFLCVLVMILGRVVNFLVPLVFAQLVRIFEEGSKVSPWPYLGAYVGLRFLQATGGLAALRDVSFGDRGCGAEIAVLNAFHRPSGSPSCSIRIGVCAV